MKKLPFLLLSFCLLAACSKTITANFYPVEGPLRQSDSISPIKAIVHDAQRTSGKVEIMMPWGEHAAGEWVVILGQERATVSTNQGNRQFGGTGSGAVLSGFMRGMYGDAVVNAPGKRQGFATLTGSQGTIIECQFISGSDGSGFGVAKDSKGNVYRVHF